MMNVCIRKCSSGRSTNMYSYANIRCNQFNLWITLFEHFSEFVVTNSLVFVCGMDSNLILLCFFFFFSFYYSLPLVV